METYKSQKQIDNEKDELIKELKKTIAEKDQALQLLQSQVSGLLPAKTLLTWIDDFVPCYVTECCKIDPIINEKYCPNCGKQIERQ